MTTVMPDRDANVVLSAEEKVTWQRFLASHREEFSGEMGRALYDDVRPDWEEYFAKAARPVTVPAPPMRVPSPAEVSAGMCRAMFDDVRPDWERYFGPKAHKAAA